MDKAHMWDMVKIHYTGYRPDNTIFESTASNEPLEIVLGSEVLIEGLENAIVGMKPGEKKQLIIPPLLAFGERDKDLIIEVSKMKVFGDLEINAGQTIELPNDDVGLITFKVASVNGDKISLDGNHELAGMTLKFDLELVEIVPDPSNYIELIEPEQFDE